MKSSIFDDISEVQKRIEELRKENQESSELAKLNHAKDCMFLRWPMASCTCGVAMEKLPGV